MELKDFVKGTISDIALAIKELNDEKSNIGLLVNPNNYDQIKANEFLFIGDGRLVKDGARLNQYSDDCPICKTNYWGVADYDKAAAIIENRLKREFPNNQ